MKVIKLKAKSFYWKGINNSFQNLELTIVKKHKDGYIVDLFGGLKYWSGSNIYTLFNKPVLQWYDCDKSSCEIKGGI